MSTAKAMKDGQVVEICENYTHVELKYWSPPTEKRPLGTPGVGIGVDVEIMPHNITINVPGDADVIYLEDANGDTKDKITYEPPIQEHGPSLS